MAVSHSKTFFGIACNLKLKAGSILDTLSSVKGSQDTVSGASLCLRRIEFPSLAEHCVQRCPDLDTES